MIGRTIAHYRIVGPLGAGGMGIVWRAVDTKLEREVALKTLPDDVARDATARAFLLREARLASALNHPHICTIHEVGDADGAAYIAMELVEGHRLDTIVGTRGLPPETVVRYGTQIADALAYAHEHGIVHRDLKAANLIVTPGGRIKVLDFGIAAHTASAGPEGATRRTLSVDGAVVGTPGAIAPEVLRGARADARSDLWSLGVVLHEMAGGGPPFRGTTPIERDAAVLHSEPEALPAHVPPGLAAVIRRCLAKDPALRYQQAAEVRAALEALAPGTDAARPGAARGRVPRALAASLAVAAVVVAAVLAFDLGGVRTRLVTGAGIRAGTGGAGGERIGSLAVLPLENLSGDAGQQFLADGMTEELTTALAQIASLRVISRTSAMRFRDSPLSMQEIGRRLGVDAVVQGSVQRSSDRVRVTAQLVRTRTDEHLWARSYERTLTDALALQDEIAGAIAREVQGRLTPAERERLAGARPVSARAYELYLRGMDAYRRWDPASERTARDLLTRALGEDSTYAAAWAGLALVHLQHAGPETPQEEDVLARRAVERAIALDPGLGLAHAVLGEIEQRAWNWEASEREYRRACALAPSLFEAHHGFSHLLLDLGRIEESNEHSRVALALDPLNTAAIVHMGWQLLVEGRYPEAVRTYREALQLDPGYAEAHIHLAYIGLLNGAPDEAEASWRRAFAITGRGDSLWFKAVVAARRERAAEAAAAVDAMIAGIRRGDTTYGESAVAECLGQLGRRDAALDWLDRAVTAHDSGITQMHVNPFLAPLRGNPRFAAIARRMGLPGGISGRTAAGP